MHAVIFPEPNKVDFVDVPIPILGEREVLVRSQATSISPGTELLVLQGKLPLIQRGEKTYPLVPGYENCGEVVELGSAVSTLKVGDVVFCEGNSSLPGLTSCWGGHCEYVRVPEQEAFQVPMNLTPEEATFTCLTATGLHAAQRGKVGVGDTVVIYGQGILGLLALQAARLAGADSLVAVDLFDGRLQLARELGASECINASQEDPLARIMDLTGGQGADVVIEATGSAELAARAPLACRDRGRLVLLGMYSQPLCFDYWDLYPREIDIYSSRGAGPKINVPPVYYRWTWTRSYKESLRLISTGRVRVAPLITHRFPIAEIQQGYQALLGCPSATLKVMLHWR